jgi:fructose-bisphosphate aldolase class II
MPLEDNIALTRQAVELADGIPVEGELGGVGGDEDSSGEQETTIPMTDAEQARVFVEQSGVASLAVAIGNAHGVYKGEPKLDFARLEALRDAVRVPLVLHGASGLRDDDLRRAISLGVRKINVNTEIRQALFHSLEQSLETPSKGFDVTRLFGAAMKAMQQAVEDKLAVF